MADKNWGPAKDSTINDMTEKTLNTAHEVPAQIFNELLRKLQDAKVSPAIIKQLGEVLHSDKSFTERLLSDALLSEEQLP